MNVMWRKAHTYLFAGLTLGITACSLPDMASKPKGQPRSANEPASPPAVHRHGLRAPESPRDWHHARRQAAQRMVEANPDGAYLGEPPDILLAIPVLTIELNGDGTVRHITVMRYPGQARDTVKLAMEAVHRGAPYGDISRLPKPWKFNETFLFNAQRKFKPMTLDR